jgi:hypothetical protein
MSRLAILSVVALPIAGATAMVPAGASTGVHFRVVGSHALVHPLQPNTNIVGNTSAAVFSPKKLSAAEGTSAQCNSNPQGLTSFTVTNTGTKTAYVTYNGAVIFSLKKSLEEDICISGGAAGDKLTLGLSNKAGTTAYKGKLKITLTD